MDNWFFCDFYLYYLNIIVSIIKDKENVQSILFSNLRINETGSIGWA